MEDDVLRAFPEDDAPQFGELIGGPQAMRLAARDEAVVIRLREGSHVDVTVVLEQPQVAPHRDVMRANLAEALGLSLSHVNVKATRGEGMGFIGRGEGAAALALATLERT